MFHFICISIDFICLMWEVIIQLRSKSEVIVSGVVTGALIDAQMCVRAAVLVLVIADMTGTAIKVTMMSTQVSVMMARCWWFHLLVWHCQGACNHQYGQKNNLNKCKMAKITYNMLNKVFMCVVICTIGFDIIIVVLCVTCTKCNLQLIPMWTFRVNLYQKRGGVVFNKLI